MAWTVREVKSPLTAEMLRPFSGAAGAVYFNNMLTDSDFIQLSDWMRSYPRLGLRVGDVTDLEFLRFFPHVRHFGAAVVHRLLGSIDGLRHLSHDLESLDLGHTRRMGDDRNRARSYRSSCPGYAQNPDAHH